MANTISPTFSDEDLQTQLRLQFPVEEMWNINFKPFFNQITDEGEYFQLRFRNRVFLIDKISGVVTEKEENEVN